MKIVHCNVSADVPRVDVEYAGAIYRGAAIHGSGGIMGSGSRSGWLDMGSRWWRLRCRREMVRIYTLHRPNEGERFIDAPAVECELRAVYAPGYEVKHRVLVKGVDD